MPIAKQGRVAQGPKVGPKGPAAVSGGAPKADETHRAMKSKSIGNNDAKKPK